MTTLRQPQSVLVTGGCGFIGSAFIRFLFRQTGFTGKIVNLDLLTYAANPDNVAGAVDPARYTFVQGDIGNPELVTQMCREHAVDTIVHFAAESHVDRSIVGPGAFMHANILGTYHLLEVVRALGNIHFHHVSTDEVYGSLGPTGLFTETTPYAPNSPYSASKAASDMLVRAYHHTYGLPAIITNCSNNYGPYQFPEKLIPVVIQSCLSRKPIPVYGDGMNVRDWLYVDDHAEALWQVLQRGGNAETYNIGGHNEWANIRIVELICDLIDEFRSDLGGNTRKLITFVTDRP